MKFTVSPLLTAMLFGVKIMKSLMSTLIVRVALARSPGLPITALCAAHGNGNANANATTVATTLNILFIPSSPCHRTPRIHGGCEFCHGWSDLLVVAFPE